MELKILTPEEGRSVAEHIIAKTRREKWDHLNLDRLGLTEVPSEVFGLTGLRELDLWSNRLEALPEKMGRLTAMQHLILDANQFSSLPPVLGSLGSLESLHLAFNRIEAFPEARCLPSSLRYLYLGGSKLRELPEWIGDLQALEGLTLTGNRLKRLPDRIGELKKIKYLWLNRNEFSELSESVGRLEALEVLDLTGNRLGALPGSLRELPRLRALLLHGNDALKLPAEVLGPWHDGTDIREYDGEDPKAILDYYFRLHPTGGAQVAVAGGSKPMHEGKLILVGEGAVGKTSLAQRLIDDTFTRGRAQTKGIEIREWNLDVPRKSNRRRRDRIKLNVWDFGGQEIYHHTHQFFMTERSLYLLVLKARESAAANRLEYWLRTIEARGAASPVIVVCNEHDGQPMDLDWRGIREKCPFIVGFVKRANMKPEKDPGVAELRALIYETIGGMEHIHLPIPGEYFAVKSALEKAKAAGEPLLAVERYRDVCAENGVTEEREQDNLLDLMNALGVMLHYDLPGPVGLNLLNPAWITKGVFAILNDAELLRVRKGIVTKEELKRILTPPAYPPEKHLFIVAMMKQFQMCHEYEGDSGRYLVPDLLPEEEPELGIWDDALLFRYKYEVLQGSVMTRFMVLASRYATNVHWRKGVVLKDEGCHALVKADEDAAMIEVRIQGAQETRRDFLGEIRGIFDSIHSRPQRKDVEERVPLPDNPTIDVSYKHLFQLEGAHVSLVRA